MTSVDWILKGLLNSFKQFDQVSQSKMTFVFALPVLLDDYMINVHMHIITEYQMYSL